MNRISKIFLSLLLIVAVCFTACGDTASSQPADSSSQSQPAGSFDESTNTGTVLTASELKSLNEQISAMTVDRILNGEKLKAFDAADFDIYIENIAKKSNDEIEFDLIFGKKGSDARISAHINGLLRYHHNNGKVYNLNVYWGTLTYHDDEIILTTLDDVTIFDTDLRTAGSNPFSFQFDIGWDYCLIDTIKSGEKYYIGYMTPENQGVLEYDFSNGTKVKNNVISGTADNPTDSIFQGFGIYEYHDVNSTNLNTLYIHYLPHLRFLDNDGVQIGFICGNPGYEELSAVYNTQDTTWRNAWLKNKGKASEYDVYIIPLSTAAGQQAEKATEKLIIVGKDGKIYRSQIFDIPQLNDSFGYEDQSSGYPLEYSYNRDKDVLEIWCPYIEQNLTVNFADGTHSTQYRISSRQANREYATSKDGRYTLYLGRGSGGGDISYSMVILHNKEKDTYHYIDDIGGMYGGGEDTGFFSNGDVYIISYDDFKVYTPDMSGTQPVFSLSSNFPLGADAAGKMTKRYLLAARRDPVDRTYITIYADTDTSDNIYLDDFNLKATYKIGLHDQNGKLIKSYDTGAHVKVSPFGINPISMYLENENTLHFHDGMKTQVWTEGTVDLATGKYTSIKDYTPPVQ